MPKVDNVNAEIGKDFVILIDWYWSYGLNVIGLLQNL